MATQWARKNGISICVYGIATTLEEQIREMSLQSLSRMIDWPMPFEEHMNEWVAWTGRLADINREMLGAGQ